MLTVESIAAEVEAARAQYAPSAPAAMVTQLVPVLVTWIRLSGTAFANASDNDGSESDQDEDVGRRRRGRKRRRRGTRADRQVRRKLTSGLHRTCLGTLGVPAAVIETIVPPRPQGLQEWIARILSFLRRIGGGGSNVPPEWKPHNDAALVVVSYVRTDLKDRPDEVRELAKVLNQ